MTFNTNQLDDETGPGSHSPEYKHLIKMLKGAEAKGMRVFINKDVEIVTLQITPDKKIEIRRNQFNRKQFASLEALDKYYRDKEEEQRKTKFF